MAENYILVAGKSGGEIATFQNHLVRYLISADKTFSTELLPANGRDSEEIQDEWHSRWSEGQLTKGAGQPKDYAYRIQPLGKHKDKPPLDFAFCEVSGTDLDTLLASEERSTSGLPKELTVLLANPKLHFVLVLLCDRDEKPDHDADGPDQDAALAGLITYLKSNYGEEFAARCPVLVLASKAQEDAEDSPGVEAFIEDSLPATLAALQNWQGRYTLGDLDMGEFEHAEDGEPYLYEPKFEDTGKIFRWIYFQFTRYAVVEPFFTRLWKSVRKSVS